MAQSLRDTLAQYCKWGFASLILSLSIDVGASPTSLCQGLLQLQPLEIARTQKLSFKDTEVFRRNNDIGLQQKGDLSFTKWIELGQAHGTERNYVGLTEESKLYHMVDWTESSGLKRRIARPLAGEQKFKEIFYFDNEVLVAVDQLGQVHLYSPTVWSKSPVRKLLKQGLVTWSLSSLALVGYIAQFHPDLMPSHGGLYDYIAPIGAVLSAKMITTFVQLHRYEMSNTFPNGFLAADIWYENPEQLLSELRSIPSEKLGRIMSRSDLTHPVKDRLYPPMIEAATEGIH